MNCSLNGQEKINDPFYGVPNRNILIHSPNDLEKQNVNLVLQIFNEYTIQGLLTLGKQKCLPNLAEYFNIFYIWWTIMNVKTPYKDCQLRNKYWNPLRGNEENFRFLSVFSD